LAKVHAKLFQILAARQPANKIQTALQLNLDPSATLLPAPVNQTNVNSMLTAPIPVLIFGAIAKFALLMDKNVVFTNQNVLSIPIVTTKIHALKTFAPQNMDIAETLQSVMITMNALMTLALHPQMVLLALALILLAVALQMLHFSLLTLSCFPTKKKSIGLENAIRNMDALLVSLPLNAMITMVAQTTLAKNSIATMLQLTINGVILKQLNNLSIINLSQV
jgi:hypothetical protein